jgi:hypothetical protein
MPSFCRTSDNRIVFVIPYEREFSLIGTTDIAVEDGEHPVCSPEEIAYLCDLASRYMARPVRPRGRGLDLFGRPPAVRRRRRQSLEAVTRDYHLEVDGSPQAQAAPHPLGVRRQDHDVPPAGRTCAARICEPYLPAAWPVAWTDGQAPSGRR